MEAASTLAKHGPWYCRKYYRMVGLRRTMRSLTQWRLRQLMITACGSNGLQSLGGGRHCSKPAPAKHMIWMAVQHIVFCSKPRAAPHPRYPFLHGVVERMHQPLRPLHLVPHGHSISLGRFTMQGNYAAMDALFGTGHCRMRGIPLSVAIQESRCYFIVGKNWERAQ